MRIAMVSEHASPLAVLGGVDAGGQNVHVDALARSLAGRGHDVVVHTRRDDPDLPATVEVVPGFVVHHVDAGPPTYVPKDEFGPFLPRFAEELARYWGHWRPDVVHAHFWMSGVVSLLGTERHGIPSAVTFHALGVVKKRHQAEADTSPDVRIPAERQLIARMDRIIATCSDEVRELQRLGGDIGKIDVVPCGVDARAFLPRPSVRSRRPFQILSLGRLVPRKGVGEAVRMMAELPDAELVVAGGPPPEGVDADPEVARLRALAQECGVADRVRFVGAADRYAIPQLVADCDVAVCLPWYEPFGIVPLEIMACGRPLVGSAVGGLLDTVSEGRTGLLVAPRAPSEAAGAVRYLLDDARMRARMGQAARHKVESLYDWDQVAEATEAVYEQILTAQGPKQSVAAGKSVR